MTREEIRDLIRVLADELEEAPQGLFFDAQLNTLVNLGQRKVQLRLIPLIPWYFRKTAEFDWGTSETYSIVTDLGISDLLIFEDICHNLTNQKATPLYFCDNPNDKWQYGAVGRAGPAPRAWGYEDKDDIWILPKSGATVSNRLKAYYFLRIPDLNHDTSDTSPNVATPHMDEAIHDLIVYEVLLNWFIRDKAGADYNRMKEKAALSFTEAMYTLSMKQGFSTGRLPGAEEYLDFSTLSSNVYP